MLVFQLGVFPFGIASLSTRSISSPGREVAALRENDLANRRPPMPSLITTLGGTIAAGLFQMPIAA